MKYRAAIQRSEEGLSIGVPGLPGCWSEGDTEEEALENVKDAIRFPAHPAGHAHRHE